MTPNLAECLHEQETGRLLDTAELERPLAVVRWRRLKLAASPVRQRSGSYRRDPST